MDNDKKDLVGLICLEDTLKEAREIIQFYRNGKIDKANQLIEQQKRKDYEFAKKYIRELIR